VFHGATTEDAASCWKSDQISLIRASTMPAIREIRVDTADAIVDALCRAWNVLTAERLRSLTSYPYLEQVKI
jgi:hypothetical protein